MRSMMESLCIYLLIILSSGIASAQAPIVRAHLEPANGIIVGQPVRLVVEVFVPNYFTGSPDLPDFDLENAIVVLPQERPQNKNERINGTTYAGIAQTYTIYPQQPGGFRLPPAQIAVSYASAPPQKAETRLTLPPLTFHADIPREAQTLSYFLPTTQLTIQENWSSPLKNLRTGDTVERTITVTATRMQAMLIPPLQLDAPNGIRIYLQEPIVQDKKSDRGEFVFGRRTQSVKYLIQKEGSYTLPALELKWWSLSTNRLVTAALPAVSFAATANLNYVAELPPEPEPIAAVQHKPISLWEKYKGLIWRLTPYYIGVLLLLWLGWHFLPGANRTLRIKLIQHKQSERAYFGRLQSACRRNDKKQSYHWLLLWIGKWRPQISLEEYINLCNDKALSTEVNSLGAAIFAKSNAEPRWSGDTLHRLLRKHRKLQTKPSANALLSLNP